MMRSKQLTSSVTDYLWFAKRAVTKDLILAGLTTGIVVSGLEAEV